jgi:hypothetical protein
MDFNSKKKYGGIAITVFVLTAGLVIFQKDEALVENGAAKSPTPTMANKNETSVPGYTAEIVQTDVTIIDGDEKPIRPVDFEKIKERFGKEYDPMIVVGHGEFSDEEIDAYNDLHILKFNRVVSKDCSLSESPYIPNTFIKSCQYKRERPDHPYESLELEELVNLAGTDATAALILGRKSTDTNERLGWYLRATALASKSGPVMALAERRYTNQTKMELVDGKPVLSPDFDQIAIRLSLENIAFKMGDPRANPQKWRAMLDEKHSLQADNLTKNHMDKIDKIRLEAGLVPLGADNV